MIARQSETPALTTTRAISTSVNLIPSRADTAIPLDYNQMKLHWTKVCALISAGLLSVYAFATPANGFWDNKFFPITYMVLAIAVLIAAFRPGRATLRFAAAVGMTKGVLRGFTFLFADQNYGGTAFHFLFALMTYVIWRSFREQLSPEITKQLIQAIHDTETANTDLRASVVETARVLADERPTSVSTGSSHAVND